MRVYVRFVAIFNVEIVAVLTMTWSYIRTAMIVHFSPHVVPGPVGLVCPVGPVGPVHVCGSGMS